MSLDICLVVFDHGVCSIMKAPDSISTPTGAQKRRPPATVSKAMRAVRSENTSPELELRKALWARGYRYRLHRKSLPGKPDLVFPSHRVALFIDGDYWHGRQWKKRGFDSLEAQLSRVNNSEYWIKKINGNIARDKANNRKLRSLGWVVVRIWESDLKKSREKVVNNIIRKLQANQHGE
jgi:DNA mismatch endonuclease, patch repair protein